MRVYQYAMSNIEFRNKIKVIIANSKNFILVDQFDLLMNYAQRSVYWFTDDTICISRVADTDRDLPLLCAELFEKNLVWQPNTKIHCTMIISSKNLLIEAGDLILEYPEIPVMNFSINRVIVKG